MRKTLLLLGKGKRAEKEQDSCEAGGKTASEGFKIIMAILNRVLISMRIQTTSEFEDRAIMLFFLFMSSGQ